MENKIELSSLEKVSEDKALSVMLEHATKHMKMTPGGRQREETVSMNITSVCLGKVLQMLNAPGITPTHTHQHQKTIRIQKQENDKHNTRVSGFQLC